MITGKDGFCAPVWGSFPWRGRGRGDGGLSSEEHKVVCDGWKEAFMSLQPVRPGPSSRVQAVSGIGRAAE